MNLIKRYLTMYKKLSLSIILSIVAMSSYAEEVSDSQHVNNLRLIQDQQIQQIIEKRNSPVITEKKEPASTLNVDSEKEPEALKPSFVMKQNFTPDGRSVTAFKDIERLEKVIGEKDTAWFNPQPKDKDFSIVYRALTEKDSENIMRKTDDEDDVDYKNYKFAILSFYYKNEKQGDQLSILLPSKYENAVRIEKFGDKKDSINADLTVDDKGRLISILGPNEAVFMKQKKFVPIAKTTEKAPNLLLY